MLCEARAKIEMRDIVTAQDVLEIIELVTTTSRNVKESVENQARISAEAAKIEEEMAPRKKKPPSKNQECKVFAIAIKALADRRKLTEFTKDELHEVFSGNHSFEEILDSLNNQGYLLAKGSGRYKLVN